MMGQQPNRSVIPPVTVLHQDVQTAWNNTSQDDSILYACVNSVVCFLDEIDQEEYTDGGGLSTVVRSPVFESAYGLILLK